jgi:CubicO group peptidase (beta-lactamase class C family)
MRRYASWSLSLAVAGVLVGGLVTGFAPPAFADSPSPTSLAPDAKSAISRQLEQAVLRGDTPGVVALVTDQSGTIFEATAGRLDARGTPMPANAIFNIASMTKPVTSVAIMMLLEQGKLALEDPVSKYLQGFDKLQVITRFNEADGTYESKPATKVMTLRHLLTHTSGIGYGFASPVLARLQEGNTKSEWEFPLLHEPGEKWTYGASTRVLGMIVEKITGTTLEKYYQEHIFKPLGMVDTSFAVPAEKQSRVATLHARVDGAIQVQTGAPPPPTSAPNPSRGDGGLYSTAKDYGAFIRMLLNGGKLGSARILSERSVKLMGENHIGAIFVQQQPVGIARLTKPFPLGAGQDKFGLGFQIAATSADAATYRRAGSMSWAGLYNTEFWIDPQRKIGGVLLMQLLPFYDDGAIRTLREFEAAVYRGAR